MSQMLFSLLAENKLSEKLIRYLNCEQGEVVLHQFPDEENALTIKSPVENKHILLLVDLDKPNQKILTLIFFAELAKELGAKHITLIAPYLAYMRQDKRNSLADSLGAKYFAQLISRYFDSIITIEPHLHQYKTLDEIYSIPSMALHPTTQVAAWIKAHVDKPLIIGPDAGATEWANQIAQIIDAPAIALQKIRTSDREVAIQLPPMEKFKDYTPVLVDDLISTGRTMIEAVKKLNDIQMKQATCIAVHGVFAGNAYEELLASKVSKVVTCNTIKHQSNEIDLTELITDYLKHN